MALIYFGNPDAPLVSVIIPAHNAMPTLASTLASCCSQTHSNIEIIVVDDGSSDSTPDVTASWQLRDPRIRLVSNTVPTGVGGARNRGAREARGEVLCFVDADDLLAPESICRRLAVLRRDGADLCYSWSAVIDEADNVVRARSHSGLKEGAFGALVKYGNVLGNGSCIIVTRRAFDAVGGYDEGLFRAGAQGCEDYAFYLAVARRFGFTCCEEALVGYRVYPTNMSSNIERMLRSFDIVQQKLLVGNPELAEDTLFARNRYLLFSGIISLQRGRWKVATDCLRQIGSQFPRHVVRMVLEKIRNRWRQHDLLPRGSRFPSGYRADTAPAGMTQAITAPDRVLAGSYGERSEN